MCIIAYSAKGKLINEETIRYMFSGNSDGAGIMWKPTPNSDVQIRKGFMNINDLLNAYRHFVKKGMEHAIHCRIMTAGKVSQQCCHPFPVRALADNMMKTADCCDVVLMHNGIINYTQPKGGRLSNYSDTMLFAKNVLYPLKAQLDNPTIQLLLENSTPSRLLIMRKGASTIRLGNWVTEDGIWYSNGNYKKTYVSPYNYGAYGSYSTYGSTASTTVTTTANTASVPSKTEEDVLRGELGDAYDYMGDAEIEEYENIRFFGPHCGIVINPPENYTDEAEVLSDIWDELETAGYLVMDIYFLSDGSIWVELYGVTDRETNVCDHTILEYYPF